jgi:hypothetical protein
MNNRMSIFIPNPLAVWTCSLPRYLSRVASFSSSLVMRFVTPESAYQFVSMSYDVAAAFFLHLCRIDKNACNTSGQCDLSCDRASTQDSSVSYTHHCCCLGFFRDHIKKRPGEKNGKFKLNWAGLSCKHAARSLTWLEWFT